MSLEQTTFLGASVNQFNGSIGWGDTPSTLNVSVVEDPDNGDSFTNPVPGTPVSFVFNDFRFDGIVRSAFKRNSDSANPGFEIVLEDPREILTGVQLILNNYYSSINNVPNLLNVYGYWESQIGFGSSQINDVGIPWRKVRDAIIALTLGNFPSYGGPIVLWNYSYEINLSALPNIPEEYRITATNMSLMDFILEVCDAANHDFFFTLVTDGLTNTIVLNTADRNAPPVLGAITNFISQTEGAIVKDSGFELRNEVTSKFITGGNVSKIYLQSNQGGDDEDLETEPEDNTIWPFWGFDPDGNAILGRGVGNDHEFSIDTRGVYIIKLQETYWSDIGEMRAARESQASWETYLWFNNNNVFKFDADGTRIGLLVDPSIPLDTPRTIEIQFNGITQPVVVEYEPIIANNNIAPTSSPILAGRRFAPYLHSNQQNIHFAKCTRYKIPGYLGLDIVSKIIGNTLTAEELENLKISSMYELRQQAIEDQWRNSPYEEPSKQLYSFLKQYADEYYGKKFMVRIPFIFTDINTDLQVRLSAEPDTSGFLDESEWETAIDNNLLPYEIDKLLDPDNKIYCYVRYDIPKDSFPKFVDPEAVIGSPDSFNYYMNFLDWNQTPQELVAYNYTVKNREVTGISVFIRCEIEPYIVYTDKDTRLSPRVVINLPDLISPFYGNDKTRLFGIFRFFFDLFVDYAGQEATDQVLKDLINKFGSDLIQLPMAGVLRFPDIAAIPMRSNIQTYGPWYATGANGKLEYEQDESLVPWNFGGYTAMNAMGQAKVYSAISQYLTSEAGSIEVPGTPTLNLGSQLMAAGPYVSDINVQIGPQGVTTSYNMRVWTPHPYKIRKTAAERLQKTALLQQRIRRDLRKKDFFKSKSTLFRKTFVDDKPQNKTTSSHVFMVGETIRDSNDRYRSEVFIQPPYNTAGQLKGDYDKKSAVSLDALFRPFSTDYNASGIAHFEQPTSSGNNVINLTSLNPFTSGTDILTSTFRSSVPNTLALNQDHDESDFRSPIVRGGVSEQEFDNLRGIALRGPVIITGWGYDTGGKPVPNSGVFFDSGRANDVFHQDYKSRSDLWKTGPLDTRWDDDRKVWVATSSQKLVQIIDKIPNNLPYPSGEINKEEGIRFYSGDHTYPISTNYLSYTSFNYDDNGTTRKGYRSGAIYYVRYINLFHSGVIGSRVELRPSDQFAVAAHFRPSMVEPSSIWIAQNIDNILVLDNQTTLIDFNISTQVV